MFACNMNTSTDNTDYLMHAHREKNEFANVLFVFVFDLREKKGI